MEIGPTLSNLMKYFQTFPGFTHNALNFDVSRKVFSTIIPKYTCIPVLPDTFNTIPINYNGKIIIEINQGEEQKNKPFALNCNGGKTILFVMN